MDCLGTVVKRVSMTYNDVTRQDRSWADLADVKCYNIKTSFEMCVVTCHSNIQQQHTQRPRQLPHTITMQNATGHVL